MNHFYKIFALVIAMILVLGMTSAFAASIKINPNAPTGTEADQISTTYHWYKLMDASINGTAVSYYVENTSGNAELISALTNAKVTVSGAQKAILTPTTSSDSSRVTFALNTELGTVANDSDIAKAMATALQGIKGKALKNAPVILSYTITFLNYDETTLLQSSEVAAGERPKYDRGDAPTKPEDNEHTYSFTGWVDANDPEGTVFKSEELPEVTGDATYTAAFTAAEKDQQQEQPEKQPEALIGEENAAGTEEATEKVEDVTITFNNWDDSVLAQVTVLTGFQPKYDGTPTRPDTTIFYVFEKWEDVTGGGSGTYYKPDELPEASADATYKATFKEGAEGTDFWTITWQNDDGSALDPATTKVAVNTQPTHDEPTKADNNFIGWKDTSGTVYTSSNLPAATANMTYQAQYQTGSITIIIDPNNGEEKTTLKGNVGAKLPEIKNPTKANSALAGWKRNDKTEIDAALPTEFKAEDDGKTYNRLLTFLSFVAFSAAFIPWYSSSLIWNRFIFHHRFHYITSCLLCKDLD